MNRNKNEPMTRYWPGAITCRKAGEGQEESRQAVLSLSSEEPCRRWFGNEILCHDAGAINLARLKEIGVVLFNLGRQAAYFRRGDRIAQLVIQPVLYPEIELAEALASTDRGSSGFGSTGR